MPAQAKTSTVARGTLATGDRSISMAHGGGECFGRAPALVSLLGLLGLLGPLAILGLACQPPPPRGCGRDRDCKGPRVCDHGRCVDPKVAPRCAPTAATARPAPGLRPMPRPPRVPAPPPLTLAAPAPRVPAGLFRLDPWRRGRSAFTGPATRPRRAWRVRVGGAISASPTVAADGTIYIGSQAGWLAAVHPTGRLRWRRRLPEKIWSTAALSADGRTLYVGADDDRLHALDAATGTPRWALTLGSCPVRGAKGRDAVRCDVDSSPVVGPDGTIYVGGDGLFAVRPDGTLRWHFRTGKKVRSSPALLPDGTLVVGCQDGRIYAVDAAGKQKWVYAAGADVDATPALGPDGTIYVGVDDGRLLALRHDGAYRWALLTGGPIRSSAAVGADGTIYASSHDGKLYAVDPRGRVRWVVATARRLESSPVVDAAGRIYVASQDRHLYAVDATGTLLWRHRFPDEVDSTVAVGPTGALHVGCDDGNLYTLR